MSAARIDELRDKLRDLEGQAERTEVSLGELNTMFRTYVSLARRTGLPENMMDAISRIYQIKIAVTALYHSMMLLYMASGPVGWITAIGGIGVGTIMLADQLAMERPTY